MEKGKGKWRAKKKEKIREGLNDWHQFPKTCHQEDNNNIVIDICLVLQIKLWIKSVSMIRIDFHLSWHINHESVCMVRHLGWECTKFFLVNSILKFFVNSLRFSMIIFELIVRFLNVFWNLNLTKKYLNPKILSF